VKIIEYNNNLVVDICNGYNIFGLSELLSPKVKGLLLKKVKILWF
jgi:hypothetical protein